ncbi:MAG: hypothetical protein JNK82_29895 [Myxococcaceae bacterium]|nr:hypothetical protein [Myxococcaceae bacterium]
MLVWVAVVMTAAAPQKIAALGFTRANVGEGIEDVAADHFARQLGKQGFSVTTSNDLVALLGVERQKQLLGCADSDNSCLAELSSALGVDAVVSGSLGRFGTRYTVNVKVTSASTGATLALFSDEVGSEDALPGTLSRAAEDIAEQLRPSKRVPTGTKVALGLGYGAAAALLAASGLCFGLAASSSARLTNPSSMLAPPGAFAVARDGSLQQTVGFVLLGAGIVTALVAGLIVMLGASR